MSESEGFFFNHHLCLKLERKLAMHAHCHIIARPGLQKSWYKLHLDAKTLPVKLTEHYHGDLWSLRSHLLTGLHDHFNHLKAGPRTDRRFIFNNMPTESVCVCVGGVMHIFLRLEWIQSDRQFQTQFPWKRRSSNWAVYVKKFHSDWVWIRLLTA